MGKYYAVRNGRCPGVYESWEDCEKQVKGFSGAEFKSFIKLEDAKAYVLGELKNNGPLSQVYAYVDGSFCLEQARFSYGAVIFYNGEKLEFCKAFDDPELVSMRNVAGEIKGAEFVMQFCLDNQIDSIDIYYDYEGIEKWCTKEWKTTRLGTLKYALFYQEVSKSVKVNFIKVKGHSGDEFNDLADRLAKKALGISE